jgi:hypothetical protein
MLSLRESREILSTSFVREISTASKSSMALLLISKLISQETFSVSLL